MDLIEEGGKKISEKRPLAPNLENPSKKEGRRGFTFVHQLRCARRVILPKGEASRTRKKKRRTKICRSMEESGADKLSQKRRGRGVFKKRKRSRRGETVEGRN